MHDGPARPRKTHVSIKNMRGKRVTVIDLLNGSEQELKWNQEGRDIGIAGFNVPDYPIVIRIIL